MSCLSIPSNRHSPTANAHSFTKCLNKARLVFFTWKVSHASAKQPDSHRSQEKHRFAWIRLARLAAACFFSFCKKLMISGSLTSRQQPWLTSAQLASARRRAMGVFGPKEWKQRTNEPCGEKNKTFKKKKGEGKREAAKK